VTIRARTGEASFNSLRDTLDRDEFDIIAVHHSPSSATEPSSNSSYFDAPPTKLLADLVSGREITAARQTLASLLDVWNTNFNAYSPIPPPQDTALALRRAVDPQALALSAPMTLQPQPTYYSDDGSPVYTVGALNLTSDAKFLSSHSLPLFRNDIPMIVGLLPTSELRKHCPPEGKYTAVSIPFGPFGPPCVTTVPFDDDTTMISLSYPSGLSQSIHGVTVPKGATHPGVRPEKIRLPCDVRGWPDERLLVQPVMRTTLSVCPRFADGPYNVYSLLGVHSYERADLMRHWTDIFTLYRETRQSLHEIVEKSALPSHCKPNFGNIGAINAFHAQGISDVATITGVAGHMKYGRPNPLIGSKGRLLSVCRRCLRVFATHYYADLCYALHLMESTSALMPYPVPGDPLHTHVMLPVQAIRGPGAFFIPRLGAYIFPDAAA
jgi:hypothetical protein